MSEQVTLQKKLELKKETVQTILNLKQPRKVKACFANLWTAYFCDCFTCEPAVWGSN